METNLLTENIIDKYLDILSEQLKQFGISKSNPIIEDIKIRMYSLLAHWDDVQTRKGILLFSLEEANYYLPKADLDVKAFVVCTIRNSLLESAGSDFYQNYNFERQLEDEEIKKITMQAIAYFNNCDLTSIKLASDNADYYDNVNKKYPLAWDIILKVSNLSKNDLYFEKIEISSKKVYILTNTSNVKIHSDSVIEDGISPYINASLSKYLDEAVKDKEIGFFSDSFKMLTRNYEKLLKVIEFLLERDSKFITFNYYISNGYIARRKVLLKPSHQVKELKMKFNNKEYLTKKHKKILDQIRSNI